MSLPAIDALPPALYLDLVGVPYLEDGRDPNVGLDCLGAVIVVARRRGFAVEDPTVERLAERWPRSWEAVDRPVPGDAVLWQLADGAHIGVLVSPRRVLHAARGAGVVVSPLGAAHRAAGFYRPRRAPQEAAGGPAALPGSVSLRIVQDGLRAGGRSSATAPADGSPVGAFLPAGWEAAPEKVSIVLDGRRIPRDQWADVVPRAGSELVLFRMPRFGAAFFAALGAEAGGALITTAGALTLLGSVIATGLTVIVGIGLSYITSALLAPAGPARREGEEGSPTYNLDGIRNSIRPGGPIPVCYGTVTVGGQILQSFYDVDEDGRAVLFVLTCLSQGEIDSIGGLGVVDRLGGGAIPEAFKINGNPARNYSGVRVSTRVGLTDQDVIPGFGNLVVVASYNVTLDDTVAFVHTTADAIDAFQLNFFWPRGLGEFDATSGNLFPITVTYLVEWRPRDTTAWVSSGTLSITRGTTGQFNSKFKRVGLALDRYEIRVTVLTPQWPPENDRQFWEMKLATVNEIREHGLNFADLAVVGWEAVATNQLNGGLPTFVVENVRGKKIQIWDGVSETAPAFVKQWSDSPAWCAADVILNRRYALGAFYDAATPLLPSFADAETFHGELVADGRGGTHRRGVCNLVLDTTRKGWDAVNLILAPFRTVPVLFGRRIRLRLEQSVVSGGAVVYSQLFTMGNTLAGSFRMTFRNPAIAANFVEVQFPNEETNFESDLMPRANTAALQAGAPLVKATISYPVITHPGRAARAAQFRLNLEVANPHSLEFSAILDSIAVEPGDVFAYQHDVPGSAVGGRFAYDQPTDAFQISSDFTVPFSERWVLLYRTIVGGVETFLKAYVNPGTYVAGADISPVDAGGAPLVFANPPQRFDIYTLGPPTQVVVYYRCADITLNPDLSRRVLGVEYVDSVYDDNPGAVPEATDELPTRRQHPDPVAGIRALERSLRQRDGTVTQSAEVAWQTGRGELCDVYVRRASS